MPNGDKITLKQLIDPNSQLPFLKGFHQSTPAPKLPTTLGEWQENMRKLKAHTIQEFLETGFTGPDPRSKGAHAPNEILLALVIEKASGMSVEQYFEKSIFEPLKLQNTSIPLDYEKMPEPFAHGYTKVELNNSESEIDASIANPRHPLMVAVSNLPDLKILAEAVGTGSLLSKRPFQQMQERQEGTSKIWRGLGIESHNGWLTPVVSSMPGYDAVVAYLPKEKAIFVCLINTDTYVEENDRRFGAARFIARAVSSVLNLPLMETSGFSAKHVEGASEKGKSH